MSLVLTRNQYLRQHWRVLRGNDPESSPIWEKSILPKTLRSPKLYGWYHNSPYAQWNNYSYYALEKRTLKDTVAQMCFRRSELSKFCELLKIAEISVLREISDQGPYTIFAPSNSALERLPGGWDSISRYFRTNPVQVRKFLRMHILRGNRRVRASRTLQISDPYKNLENKNLLFSMCLKSILPADFSGNINRIQYAVQLDGSSLPLAPICDFDFRAHNGYVTVIDGILGFSKSDLITNSPSPSSSQ